MSLLRFQIKGDCGSLIVKFENGVKLGEMLVNDDGYYVYFPELNEGYWDAGMMRAIADTLDKLNAPWDARVNAFLESQITGNNYTVVHS
jgi:hypothetical protein